MQILTIARFGAVGHCNDRVAESGKQPATTTTNKRVIVLTGVDALQLLFGSASASQPIADDPSCVVSSPARLFRE